MKPLEFPDVYCAADKQAARMQSQYFRLLGSQYFCLFIASSLTLLSGFLNQGLLLGGYFVLLLGGTLAALMLETTKSNQNWYKFRALAESSKTLSWRYMMGSKPFGSDLETGKVNAKFAKRLHELVAFPRLDSAQPIATDNTDEQATAAMQQLRKEPFEKRKEFYLSHRIEDQMTWYEQKAKHNQLASKLSLILIVGVYLAAIITSGIQFYRPISAGQVVWISEPLLVLAASLLGYVHSKRFAELSASYALTALEIQKLRAGFLSIEDEAEFVEYVNEAENAFSREHTQWIARVV